MNVSKTGLQQNYNDKQRTKQNSSLFINFLRMEGILHRVWFICFITYQLFKGFFLMPKIYLL